MKIKVIQLHRQSQRPSLKSCLTSHRHLGATTLTAPGHAGTAARRLSSKSNAHLYYGATTL